MARWTIVQAIPELKTGGAERSTLEVAAALVAAGHRSIVISAGGPWLSRLLDAGSEHWPLAIGAKSLRSLALVGSLRRRMQAEGVDLLHARSRLPAWIGWWALRRLRPRPAFVTTLHGLNSPGRYSAIMARGDRVICVSETARAHLLHHYPDTDPARLRVIPRGVDPEAFPSGHRPTPAWRQDFLAQFPQLAGGLLLTLPGRGTRLKGHLDAIALLAELRRRGVDARLLLLGVIEDGREAYLAELQRAAAAAGVDPHLALSPPRADVREVYALSDLVLQLSVRPESFGRIVVEALQLGRPVLGYDHGGVGELLRQHFPAGASPLGDIAAAADRAQAILATLPAIDASRLPQVRDLQAATLAVYGELLDRRDPA